MKLSLCAFATVLAINLAPTAVAQGTSPEILENLPTADVVLLGEVHDNPIHHELQARAAASLVPAAIVWEMLTSEQASRLPADLSDARVVAQAIDWDDSGWPDFGFYHPIMMAAPDAVHFGAEVTRDQARRVFDTALPLVFDDLFGAGSDTFGLSVPLSPDDQASREAMQAAAHCDALPEYLLPGMVDAQRLRDAVLALQVINALEQTGGPVAVITGWGHARRDIGVPRKLAAAAPAVRVHAVAMLESEPEPDAPFDIWIVTDAQPRDDPCAAFR